MFKKCHSVSDRFVFVLVVENVVRKGRLWVTVPYVTCVPGTFVLDFYLFVLCTIVCTYYM